MLKNYLKIALRNIRKYKWYSVLNIAGLSIGLACSALILLYVWFELSYDNYHLKGNRIYMVYHQDPGNVFKGSDYFAVESAPLGRAMEADFPEVESSVKFTKWDNQFFSVDKKGFFEKNVLFSEPELLSIFSFPLKEGNAQIALTEPNTVVLSKEIAQKYFDNSDPINKIIKYNNKLNLRVTGVLDEIPANSHLRPSIVISFSTYEQMNSTNKYSFRWGNNSFHTYILLKKGADVENVKRQMSSFAERHMGNLFRKWGKEVNYKYSFLPLKDVHLHSSHINFGVGISNDLSNIYVMIALAFVVLLAACINYVNLSTARASLRGKEVGVRKVIGARKGELIKQFMGESLLLTIIAAIIALLLIELVLPEFSDVVQQEFSLSFVSLPIIVSFIAFVLLIGLLSGIYPAFFLSAHNPVKVLKGVIQNKKSGFRNTLVVVQFAIAIILIISIAVILSQLNYIKTQNLGYNRNQVVVINAKTRDERRLLPVLKSELLKISGVENASISTALPINMNSTTGVSGIDSKGSPKEFNSYQLYVDYDFFDTYGIKITKGRSFSKEYSSDSLNSCIVNEEFVRELGWKNGTGKSFTRNKEKVNIVGVIKDIHMQSMHLANAPLFIQIIPSDYWKPFLSLKLNSSGIGNTLKKIKTRWSSVIKNYPIDYSFLNDDFNKMYEKEERLSEIVYFFAFLTLIISSLGLLGLTAFICEQRRKEIGIRKVLGASINSIVTMLSKEFLSLVILSNIIAWPIAYYFMNNWLKDFAYRINFPFWILFASGFLAVIVALLTISSHAIRTAKLNPVESLRQE